MLHHFDVSGKSGALHSPIGFDWVRLGPIGLGREPWALWTSCARPCKPSRHWISAASFIHSGANHGFWRRASGDVPCGQGLARKDRETGG